MTRDEVEHEESTNKVILTQGPLVFKTEEEQSGGKLNICVIVQGMIVGTLNRKEMFRYLDALLNLMYTIHVTWTSVNQSAIWL